MAYTTLINDIQAVIKNNGNQEITGQVLQTALVEMVNELGSGYTYKGVATLSTTPDVTTPNIFYLLGAAGTYTNIGGIQHASGIGIALWNGSAWSYQNVPNSAIMGGLENKVNASAYPNHTTQGYELTFAELPYIGMLTANGGIDATQTNYKTSEFIPTDCIDSVFYYRTAANNGVQVYDKDFTLLASLGWSSGNTKLDLTQYPSHKYIRVSAYSTAFSLKVDFSNYVEKRNRIFYPFATTNGYVMPTNGNIQQHADYTTFSFKVREGVSYTFPQYYSGTSIGYAFIDKFGVFVSGGILEGSMGSNTTLTTPKNASTLRISCHTLYKAFFSVEVDISTLSSSPDDYSVTDQKVAVGAISPAKTDFLPIAENVNLITGWESGFIDGTGTPRNDGTLCRTTAVLMSSNESYYIRNTINGLCAFYDIDGNVLASYANGEGPLGTQPYMPPIGTYYGRFTVANSTYKERAYISVVDRKCSYFTREVSPIISLFGGEYCNYNGREASLFNKGVAIGDSLTQGVFNHNEGGTMEYLTDTKYSWPSIFAKISGVQMENKGVGSYSSVQWWENKGEDDLSGYDFAVISFGVNDVSQFGGFTSAVQTAYTNIINKLKTDNEGIKIFVSTIFPAISYNSVALRVTFCEDLRAFIETLSDDNVILLDLQKYGHTRDYIPYNAGHLTALGYAKLASDIYSFISFIIKTDKEQFDDVQFIGTSYSYSGS